MTTATLALIVVPTRDEWTLGMQSLVHYTHNAGEFIGDITINGSILQVHIG
jgi:hypothetical protein